MESNVVFIYRVKVIVFRVEFPFLSSNNNFNVKLVWRSTNGVAHALARVTPLSTDSMIYYVAPICIAELINY